MSRTPKVYVIGCGMTKVRITIVFLAFFLHFMLSLLLLANEWNI